MYVTHSFWDQIRALKLLRGKARVYDRLYLVSPFRCRSLTTYDGFPSATSSEPIKTSGAVMPANLRAFRAYGLVAEVQIAQQRSGPVAPGKSLMANLKLVINISKGIKTHLGHYLFDSRQLNNAPPSIVFGSVDNSLFKSRGFCLKEEYSRQHSL